MNKYVNGEIVAMDETEAQIMTAFMQQAAATERHRSLSESEVLGMLLRQQVQTIAADDATAVRMRAFYPAWDNLIGQQAEPGLKFTHGGDLYEVNPPGGHVFSEAWVPGAGTESMYRLIPEQYAGDQYDPIPYRGNMELLQGSYYTQDGVLYRCIRGSGIPVHDPLAVLATPAGGSYVEVVDA